MPFAGLGLHFIVALFFAVHVVRTGQQLYWLIILFSFPLLGSLVYFLAIYLPNSRLQRGARKMVTTVAKTLDPTRELREAREAFDYTPTAQNQMRLAAALLESDQAAESATNFEACLKGPFSNDPEMRFGAARAFFACNRYTEAISHLESIRKTDATYRAEEVSVLLAKSLGATGRRTEARGEFEQALARFGSFECRAEYAIWAATAGERELAARLQIDIQRAMERWNRHTRDLNQPLLHRLDAAYALVKQAS